MTNDFLEGEPYEVFDDVILVEPDLNPEPRCSCVLLLDVSGSMQGNPIQQLNQGLSEFQRSLQSDDMAALRVEVAIVGFGGHDEVTVEQDFVSAGDLQVRDLAASGRTPMGAAINRALDMVTERKQAHRMAGIPYYRPWIWLITDGAPTDEWRAAAQRVHDEEARKGVAFFAVGVQGANMTTLGEIAVRQPLHLKGLDFRTMFLWLSGSLSSVSRSSPGEQIPLESPMGWAEVA